jgi:hypothetical protein
VEPPWCFVKTQFGPVEGHVALIEMLRALKREFLPDLEVSDDGRYWEKHDLAELVRLRALTQEAIDGLADGLRRHGLSREAAEDPTILLRHVERVAEYVHRTLRRPSEHPPVAFEDDDQEDDAAEPEATEKLRDLIGHLDTLFRDADPRYASSVGTLYRGAGDALGGLAQALSQRDHDAPDFGLCVVQLKRALRGAAFARGALFPLRSTISAEQFAELFRVLEQMETDIVSELERVRLM